MNTSDVIRYFGSQSAAAKALGITRSAISQWGDLVPLATAARLEKLTNGALELDLNAYPRKIPSSIEVRAPASPDTRHKCRAAGDAGARASGFVDRE